MGFALPASDPDIYYGCLLDLEDVENAVCPVSPGATLFYDAAYNGDDSTIETDWNAFVQQVDEVVANGGVFLDNQACNSEDFSAYINNDADFMFDGDLSNLQTCVLNAGCCCQRSADGVVIGDRGVRDYCTSNNNYVRFFTAAEPGKTFSQITRDYCTDLCEGNVVVQPGQTCGDVDGTICDVSLPGDRHANIDGLAEGFACFVTNAIQDTNDDNTITCADLVPTDPPLQSCAAQNGYLCTQNAVCEGTEIDSRDPAVCCDVACVEQPGPEDPVACIADLGGQFCDIGYCDDINTDATDASLGQVCCNQACTIACVETLGQESVELSCNDGVDNDCDGTIDAADSDCSGTSLVGSATPRNLASGQTIVLQQGSNNYYSVIQSDGSYTFRTLPSGEYTVSTLSGVGISPSPVNLGSGQNERNFYLTPVGETSQVRIFVEDTQGIPLSNIFVRLTPGFAHKGYTGTSGSITFPYVATDNYSVFIQDGSGFHYSRTEEIEVDQNNDFTYVLQSKSCIDEAISTEEVLEASHIQGRSSVRLDWDFSGCFISEFSSFAIQRCTGEGCETFSTVHTVYDDAGSINTFWTDQTTDWQTAYTYRVVATLQNGAELLSNADTITTGDERCEGLTLNKQTCDVYHDDLEESVDYPELDELYPDESSSAFIYSCTSENVYQAVTDDENLGRLCDTTTRCVETFNGQAIVAQCQFLDICSLFTLENPFSMYYTAQTCAERGGSSQYGSTCYLDRGTTSVDSCLGCSGAMTCFDYKSEQACNANSCNVGQQYQEGELSDTCTWVSLEGDVLNRGYCAPAVEGTAMGDVCTSCAESGTCTEDICTELGCLYQDENPVCVSPYTATCSDATTLDRCELISELTGQSCVFENDNCIKPNCGVGETDCANDNRAPQTQLVTDGVLAYVNEAVLTFAVTHPEENPWSPEDVTIEVCFANELLTDLQIAGLDETSCDFVTLDSHDDLLYTTTLSESDVELASYMFGQGQEESIPEIEFVVIYRATDAAGNVESWNQYLLNIVSSGPQVSVEANIQTLGEQTTMQFLVETSTQAICHLFQGQQDTFGISGILGAIASSEFEALSHVLPAQARNVLDGNNFYSIVCLNEYGLANSDVEVAEPLANRNPNEPGRVFKYVFNSNDIVVDSIPGVITQNSQTITAHFSHLASAAVSCEITRSDYYYPDNQADYRPMTKGTFDSNTKSTAFTINLDIPTDSSGDPILGTEPVHIKCTSNGNNQYESLELTWDPQAPQVTLFDQYGEDFDFAGWHSSATLHANCVSHPANTLVCNIFNYCVLDLTEEQVIAMYADPNYSPTGAMIDECQDELISVQLTSQNQPISGLANIEESSVVCYNAREGTSDNSLTSTTECKVVRINEWVPDVVVENLLIGDEFVVPVRDNTARSNGAINALFNGSFVYTFTDISSSYQASGDTYSEVINADIGDKPFANAVISGVMRVVFGTSESAFERPKFMLSVRQNNGDYVNVTLDVSNRLDHKLLISDSNGAASEVDPIQTNFAAGTYELPFELSLIGNQVMFTLNDTYTATLQTQIVDPGLFSIKAINHRTGFSPTFSVSDLRIESLDIIPDVNSHRLEVSIEGVRPLVASFANNNDGRVIFEMDESLQILDPQAELPDSKEVFFKLYQGTTLVAEKAITIIFDTQLSDGTITIVSPETWSEGVQYGDSIEVEILFDDEQLLEGDLVLDDSTQIPLVIDGSIATATISTQGLALGEHALNYIVSDVLGNTGYSDTLFAFNIVLPAGEMQTTYKLPVVNDAVELNVVLPSTLIQDLGITDPTLACTIVYEGNAGQQSASLTQRDDSTNPLNRSATLSNILSEDGKEIPSQATISCGTDEIAQITVITDRKDPVVAVLPVNQEKRFLNPIMTDSYPKEYEFDADYYATNSLDIQVLTDDVATCTVGDQEVIVDNPQDDQGVLLHYQNTIELDGISAVDLEVVCTDSTGLESEAKIIRLIAQNNLFVPISATFNGDPITDVMYTDRARANLEIVMSQESTCELSSPSPRYFTESAYSVSEKTQTHTLNNVELGESTQISFECTQRGSTNTYTQTFTVKSNQEEFFFNTDLTNMVTTESYVDVKINGSKDYNVTIHNKGLRVARSVEDPTTSWDTTLKVPLENGQNKIVITATDQYTQNTEKRVFYLYRDDDSEAFDYVKPYAGYVGDIDEIKFRFSQTDALKYTITDLSGTNIKTGDVTSSGASRSINLGDVPDGMIIVRIYTDDRSYFDSFVLTKDANAPELDLTDVSAIIDNANSPAVDPYYQNSAILVDVHASQLVNDDSSQLSDFAYYERADISNAFAHYGYQARIVDELGNVAQIEQWAQKDRAAPFVYSQNIDGEIVNTATPTFVLNYSEPVTSTISIEGPQEAGFDNKQYITSLGASQYTASQVVQISSTNELVLPGTYTVNVRLTDPSLQRSEGLTFDFEYVPDPLEIYLVKNEELVSSEEEYIVYRSDSTAVTNLLVHVPQRIPEYCTITVGEFVDTISNPQNNDILFENINLNPTGLTEVHFLCEDVFANQKEETFNVRFTTAPPTISGFSLPQAVFADDTYTMEFAPAMGIVSFTTDHPTTCTYEATKEDGDTETGTIGDDARKTEHSQKLDLLDAAYTITCTNIAGQSGTHDFSVVVNNQDDSDILLISPSRENYISTQQFELRLAHKDYDAQTPTMFETCTYILNGNAPVTMQEDGVYFTRTITAHDNADTIIEITCEYLSGNPATTTLTKRYDPSDPELEITGLQDYAYSESTGELSLSVDITAADPESGIQEARVLLRQDGDIIKNVPITIVDENTYTLAYADSGITNEEADFTWEVIVTNGAGATVSQSLDFTIRQKTFGIESIRPESGLFGTSDIEFTVTTARNAQWCRYTIESASAHREEAYSNGNSLVGSDRVWTDNEFDLRVDELTLYIGCKATSGEFDYLEYQMRKNEQAPKVIDMYVEPHAPDDKLLVIRPNNDGMFELVVETDVDAICSYEIGDQQSVSFSDSLQTTHSVELDPYGYTAGQSNDVIITCNSAYGVSLDQSYSDSFVINLDGQHIWIENPSRQGGVFKSDPLSAINLRAKQPVSTCDYELYENTYVNDEWTRGQKLQGDMLTGLSNSFTIPFEPGLSDGRYSLDLDCTGATEGIGNAQLTFILEVDTNGPDVEIGLQPITSAIDAKVDLNVSDELSFISSYTYGLSTSQSRGSSIFEKEENPSSTLGVARTEVSIEAERPFEDGETIYPYILAVDKAGEETSAVFGEPVTVELPITLDLYLAEESRSEDLFVTSSDEPILVAEFNRIDGVSAIQAELAIGEAPVGLNAPDISSNGLFRNYTVSDKLLQAGTYELTLTYQWDSQSYNEVFEFEFDPQAPVITLKTPKYGGVRGSEETFVFATDVPANCTFIDLADNSQEELTQSAQTEHTLTRDLSGVPDQDLSVQVVCDRSGYDLRSSQDFTLRYEQADPTFTIDSVGVKGVDNKIIGDEVFIDITASKPVICGASAESGGIVFVDDDFRVDHTLTTQKIIGDTTTSRAFVKCIDRSETEVQSHVDYKPRKDTKEIIKISPNNPNNYITSDTFTLEVQPTFATSYCKYFANETMPNNVPADVLIDMSSRTVREGNQDVKRYRANNIDAVENVYVECGLVSTQANKETASYQLNIDQQEPTVTINSVNSLENDRIKQPERISGINVTIDDDNNIAASSIIVVPAGTSAAEWSEELLVNNTNINDDNLQNLDLDPALIDGEEYELIVMATDVAGRTSRDSITFYADLALDALIWFEDTDEQNGVITTPYPQFNITFTRPEYTVETITLIRPDESTDPATPAFTAHSAIVEFQTLPIGGDYILEVNYTNSLTNQKRSKTFDFTFEPQPVEITLTSPKYGAFNQNRPTITFETDLPATCSAGGNVLTASDGGLTHSIQLNEFPNSQQKVPFDLTVECNATEYDVEESELTVELYFDRESPQLTLGQEYPLYPDGLLRGDVMTIPVEEVSEAVACRVSEAESQFEDMEGEVNFDLPSRFVYTTQEQNGNINIVCIDRAENQWSSQVSYQKARSDESIFFIQPNEDGYITELPFTLVVEPTFAAQNCTYIVDNEGVDDKKTMSSYQDSVDGVEVTRFSAPSVNANGYIQVFCEEGYNPVGGTISIDDDTTVLVDTQEPVIDTFEIKLIDGYVKQPDKIKDFELSISDNKVLQEVTIVVENSSGEIYSKQVTQSENSYEESRDIDLAQPLADGESYTLSVTATDAAGHKVEDEIVFEVDLSLDAIITFTDDTQQETSTITGSDVPKFLVEFTNTEYKDEVFGLYRGTSLIYRDNELEEQTTNEPEVIISLPEPLTQSGQYTLLAEFGNRLQPDQELSREFDFTFRPAPVDINLTHPTPYSQSEDSAAFAIKNNEFTFTVESSGTATCTYDVVEQGLEGQTFQTEDSIVHTSQEITVSEELVGLPFIINTYCDNGFGDISQKRIEFYYDPDAPSIENIEVQGLRNGVLYIVDETTVSFETTENTFCTVEGFESTQPESSYLVEITDIGDGGNDYTINCQDMAGNDASAAFSIAREANPNQIVNFTTPTYNQKFNTSSITVEVETKLPLATYERCKYGLDDTSLSDFTNLGADLRDTFTVESGEHMLYVYCENSAGVRTTIDELPFVVDTTDPQIEEVQTDALVLSQDNSISNLDIVIDAADEQTGISFVEIMLGTRADPDSAFRHFAPADISSYTVDSLDLEHGTTYYWTVIVTNDVGRKDTYQSNAQVARRQPFDIVDIPASIVANSLPIDFTVRTSLDSQCSYEVGALPATVSSDAGVEHELTIANLELGVSEVYVLCDAGTDTSQERITVEYNNMAPDLTTSIEPASPIVDLGIASVDVTLQTSPAAVCTVSQDEQVRSIDTQASEERTVEITNINPGQYDLLVDCTSYTGVSWANPAVVTFVVDAPDESYIVIDSPDANEIFTTSQVPVEIDIVGGDADDACTYQTGDLEGELDNNRVDLELEDGEHAIAITCSLGGNPVTRIITANVDTQSPNVTSISVPELIVSPRSFGHVSFTVEDRLAIESIEYRVIDEDQNTVLGPFTTTQKDVVIEHDEKVFENGISYSVVAQATDIAGNVGEEFVSEQVLTNIPDRFTRPYVSVNGQLGSVIETSIPVFTVNFNLNASFNGNVTVDQVTQAGGVELYELNTSQEIGRSFVLESPALREPGDYKLMFSYWNYSDENRELTYYPGFDFEFDPKPVEITLKQPEYGGTPNTTTEFVFETNDIANCSYSWLPTGSKTPLESENNITHSKSITITAQNTAYTMYVSCQSQFGETTTKTVPVIYDTTAPQIQNISVAEENEFTGIIYTGGQATVVFETSEPALCGVGNISQTFEDMSPITTQFTTTFTKAITTEDDTHTVQMACINRAGLESRAQYTLQFGDEGSQDIIFVEPSESLYTSASLPITIELLQDASAICSYRITTDGNTTSGPMNFGNGQYSTSSISFDPGDHTISVTCDPEPANPESVNLTKSRSITVDNTAPLFESIVTPAQLRRDRYGRVQLEARFNFEDEESGIDKYEYAIGTAQYGSDGWDSVVSLTNTSGDRPRETVIANVTDVYYWSVRAYNELGSSSAFESSNGTTILSYRPPADDDDDSDDDRDDDSRDTSDDTNDNTDDDQQDTVVDRPTQPFSDNNDDEEDFVVDTTRDDPSFDEPEEGGSLLFPILFVVMALVAITGVVGYLVYTKQQQVPAQDIPPPGQKPSMPPPGMGPTGPAPASPRASLQERLKARLKEKLAEEKARRGTDEPSKEEKTAEEKTVKSDDKSSKKPKADDAISKLRGMRANDKDSLSKLKDISEGKKDKDALSKLKNLTKK